MKSETSTDGRALLKIEGLCKAFDGVQAVSNTSLSFMKGSITAIVGPNGSGKTTLLDLLSGFQSPDSGKIVLNGSDITGRRAHERARLGIGRTFQLDRVFPEMTVVDNILLALETPRNETLWRGILGLSAPSIPRKTERVRSLLRMVGLEKKLSCWAGSLSHGERRLVELLRALALEPEMYLFDEPTAGVFHGVRDCIMRVLKELVHSGGTIILVEHNLSVVAQVAERVVVLERGQVIADGEPGHVLQSPAVIAAYFGYDK